MALRAPLMAVAAIFAVVAVVYAGTYVSYFIVAMQRPPKSPFTIACTQVAAPTLRAVKVRFDIVNSASKDSTFLNLALFPQHASRRNLSDWGYALQTRVPRHGNASATVAVPLEGDYAGLRFSGVRCNLINAAFADGSQQEYTGSNTSFP